ncbi:hypothetical protein AB0I54_08365 [Streptomyces sp. NPDC050625]|uniref:hypothetical protein n=1 Tax=Streptomyces sp. NPDC050625 TaxID=3154629 RepID=UPI003444A015
MHPVAAELPDDPLDRRVVRSVVRASAKNSLLITEVCLPVASTCFSSRVQCRSVGRGSPIIAGRAQAASAASIGCLLWAGNSTPCRAIVSFAANSAPWMAVVPVLCGPMCSRRVPGGSGAGACLVQSVSMVHGR